MFDDLKNLPVKKAPDSIWREIESSLDRPRSRSTGFSLYLAAAAALAAIAFFVYRYEADKPRWQVVRLDGAPSIGASKMGDSGRIAEGQWLETDSTSRAQISVGEIGTVQVEPNTRVRLVAARPQEHRLSLAKGEISAVVNAPPRLFFVDTTASTAVDLGCAYTMKVDDSGGGLLQVTLGWVALEWNGRESMVPAGASCRTRPKIGPGTPYFDDAPAELKDALSSFDFAVTKADPLETILPAARARDTLTLWHLLSRTQRSDRDRVLDRMLALAPLPEGVTRAQILSLDRKALDQWKDQLVFKW